MVKFKVGNVKEIAKIMVYLLFVAGILLVVVPILLGVGTKSATALGVQTENITNLTKTAMADTASVQAAVFTFLPWLGVGLLVAGAFGIAT